MARKVLTSLLVLIAPCAAQAQVRKIGPEFQVNTLFVGSQIRPSVEIERGGEFLVVWAGIFEERSELGFGIWGQRYAENGTPIGDQFLVTESEKDDQWSEADSVIACAGDELCTVAWLAQSDEDGEIIRVGAKIIDSAGKDVVPSLNVDVRPEISIQGVAVARSSSGHSMIVWHDAGPPMQLEPSVARGQLFARDGEPLTGPIALAASTSNTRQPQVVVTENDDFIVTWWGLGSDSATGFDIYARRFSDDGVAVAPEFRLNDVADGVQQRPTLAPSTDGGFLAAWESGGHAEDDYLGVYARRFSAQDSAVGPERHVNTYTPDSQVVPIAEPDGRGGFIVAWVSVAAPTGPSQDGTGPGVFGRRLHDDGTPHGLEFQINDFTSGAQGWLTWPIGLSARNGTVVATWQSDSQDSFNEGIFAQRFQVDPATGHLCGDAYAQDLRLTILDALGVIRSTAGLRSCLACLCDVDGSGATTAADALAVLRSAVGLNAAIECPACQLGGESPAGIS